eukprot:m.390955 g.390955  ORF g.390955 m.390955 type:complete len:81 (-) comp20079_c0_seq1:8-250(-)
MKATSAVRAGGHFPSSNIGSESNKFTSELGILTRQHMLLQPCNQQKWCTTLLVDVVTKFEPILSAGCVNPVQLSLHPTNN